MSYKAHIVTVTVKAPNGYSPRQYKYRKRIIGTNDYARKMGGKEFFKLIKESVKARSKIPFKFQVSLKTYEMISAGIEKGYLYDPDAHDSSE